MTIRFFGSSPSDDREARGEDADDADEGRGRREMGERTGHFAVAADGRKAVAELIDRLAEEAAIGARLAARSRSIGIGGADGSWNVTAVAAA